jgi:hypothetical protein
MVGFGPENGDFGACLLTDPPIDVYLRVFYMWFILFYLWDFRGRGRVEKCVSFEGWG